MLDLYEKIEAVGELGNVLDCHICPIPSPVMSPTNPQGGERGRGRQAEAEAEAEDGTSPVPKPVAKCLCVLSFKHRSLCPLLLLVYVLVVLDSLQECLTETGSDCCWPGI